MANDADKKTDDKAAAPKIARSLCPTSFEARNLMVAATAFSERILKLTPDKNTPDDNLKQACQTVYLAACQGFDEASLKDLRLSAGAMSQVTKALQGLGFAVEDQSSSGPVVGW